MENTGAKLTNIIDEFVELEILKAEILYSKFQNTLKEEYNEKIKLVEQSFLGKAKMYGKNVDDCLKEKNDIVLKYEKEFQKIYDARREQYINIQNEIQEMTANKMIVIANFKHIAKNKEEFFKLDGYKEYVSKKEKYQKILDTTLVHDEFAKYTKLLEDLQDPTEVYNRKYIALATKFDSYDEAIKQCEKKLDECINASKEDFKLIMKHIDVSLEILKKENIFKRIINKVVNKLFRGAKFEKDVVEKMENDISSIQKENDVNIELIQNQTIGLVSTIEQTRANINEQFKVAMG